jgi:hypothetical protein
MEGNNPTLHEGDDLVFGFLAIMEQNEQGMTELKKTCSQVCYP